eukprot:350228-Chlamydomonas_euryale.AAC.4
MVYMVGGTASESLLHVWRGWLKASKGDVSCKADLDTLKNLESTTYTSAGETPSHPSMTTGPGMVAAWEALPVMAQARGIGNVG